MQASFNYGNKLHRSEESAANFHETAGMLVDRGCKELIVTNIGAFLDLDHIQSVVRNPFETSRVVRRSCVRISIPSNESDFICELNKILICF